MTATHERLCSILIKQHKLPPDRLTLDAPLESLGIDSLGTVELLWNVEDEFQIKMPANPVDLSTLGDVVAFIDGLVAGPGRTAVAAVSTGPIVGASGGVS